MKLSMSMILEYLADSIAEHRFSSSTDLVVSGFSLYSSSVSDRIYLVNNEQMPDLIALNPFVCIAAVGQIDTHDIPDTCSYLRFSNDITLEEAFTLLQGVFEYYRDWELQIIAAMADQCSVEEIMDICAKPMNNPVALFDPSFVLVATGGTLPATGLDKTWSQVIDLGYFPFGKDMSRTDPVSWAMNTPVSVQTEDTVKASVCLLHNGEIIGYLGCTQLLHAITDGDMSIMAAIQSFMETDRFLSILQMPQSKKMSVLLSRLMLGYAVENSAIQYYMQSLSMDTESCFRLLLIGLSDGFSMSKAEILPAIQTLKAELPSSIAFPFEECIAVIIEASHCEAVFRNNSHLNQVIADLNLVCIASMQFAPFSYLRYAYLQCRMLQSYLNNATDPGIYDYESYYQNCLLSALDDSTNLKALCNPLVILLKNRKNGDDLLKSLRVFIMHGQNFTDAARELNIHRNTLIYRIDQIENQIGIRLGEADERTLFQLYMSCLIAE